MKFASLRPFFYQLHLWLGVVSGLILFVVCLSGSLYVFREEVRRAVAPEQFYVEASADQRLSADEIVEKVEAAKPGKKVGSLTLPESPTRTALVVLNDAPKKGEKGPRGERQGGEKAGAKPEKGGEKAGQKPQEAGKGGGKPKGGKHRGETVYVDPYTGEIVGDGKTSVNYQLPETDMTLPVTSTLDQSTGALTALVANVAGGENASVNDPDMGTRMGWFDIATGTHHKAVADGVDKASGMVTMMTVNDRAIKMPITGLEGYTPWVVLGAGLLACGAIAGVAVNRNRRKESDNQ